VNKTEFVDLLQHAEHEVDSVITSLGRLSDKRVNFAIGKLFELSLEFNTRLKHLEKEV